jgi:diacylglycerol kinase
MARYLRGLLASFGFAARGLAVASRQRNMQIMLAASSVVIVLAIVLRVSRTSWAILLVCIAVVLCAEMLNTGIEILADRLQPDVDPDVRDVKDVSAGAVLVLSGVSAVIGVVVFWPYVFD